MSIYTWARYLVSRIPHHDTLADADDLAHDCALWLLERAERGAIERPEDLESYTGATLRNYVRFRAAHAYSHSRRHYGWRVVSRTKGPRDSKVTTEVRLPLDVYPDAHEDPAHAWEVASGTDAHDGYQRALWRALCEAVGRACEAWDGPEWAPWAWVLVHGCGLTRRDVAALVGRTPQRIGQILHGQTGAKRASFDDLVKREVGQ